MMRLNRALFVCLVAICGCHRGAPRPAQVKKIPEVAMGESYKGSCELSKKVYEWSLTCKEGFYSCASTTAVALKQDVTNISTVWNDAIESRLNFSLALAALNVTCADAGTTAARQVSIERLGKLAGSKTPGNPNVEAYLTMAQISNAIESPSGSLLTFNAQMAGYKSQLERQFELLKLQNNK